jgi:peptidylprolyl isomerase
MPSFFFVPPFRIPPIITAQVYLDVHAVGYKKEISGRIVLGLYGESCPRTVDNFLSLIEGIETANDTGKKSWLHYKGSKFHR